MLVPATVDSFSLGSLPPGSLFTPAEILYYYTKFVEGAKIYAMKPHKYIRRFAPQHFIGHYYDITNVRYGIPNDRLTADHCLQLCRAIYPMMIEPLSAYLNDHPWHDKIAELKRATALITAKKERIRKAAEVRTTGVAIPALIARSAFPGYTVFHAVAVHDDSSHTIDRLPFRYYYLNNNDLCYAQRNDSLFTYDQTTSTFYLARFGGIWIRLNDGQLSWYLAERRAFGRFIDWMVINTIVPHSFHNCTDLKYIAKKDWTVYPKVHITHTRHENIHTLHAFSQSRYEVKIVNREDRRVIMALYLKDDDNAFYSWTMSISLDGETGRMRLLIQ